MVCYSLVIIWLLHVLSVFPLYSALDTSKLYLEVDASLVLDTIALYYLIQSDLCTSRMETKVFGVANEHLDSNSRF